MPYMCCGGTVATMLGMPWPRHRPCSATRFCPVPARKAAQVLGLGLGLPVLPEVKPMATTAASSMTGVAPASAGNMPGNCQWPGGTAGKAPSPRL